MNASAAGTVITFYSFKGGVGRSFLLANVAVTLADWGYRVLCIDWDLEAPGLDQFFRHDLSATADAPGLVDLIERFRAGEPVADCSRHVTVVGLRSFAGSLHLMTASRMDDGYAGRVQNLNWPALYEAGLGQFLERLRVQWVKEYDFVLIDSRTGITDIGGICTIQLPDILVPVFVANRQNLYGVADVVRRAARRRAELPLDRPDCLVMPVLSRFEQQVEYDLSLEWLRTIAAELREVYTPWLDAGVEPVEFLTKVKIPYVPYWSYGERLAVLKETDPAPGDISYAFHAVAALLARRLADSGQLLQARDSYLAAAKRTPTAPSARRMRVFLSSTFKDLQPYRHAVAQAVRNLDASRYELYGLERWAPGRAAPSVDEVRGTMAIVDVLVGLYGYRMGSPCPETTTAVIEADYRAAVERGLPVLAFFAGENAAIPPKFVDRGEGAARVDTFRTEVTGRHAVALFNTPEEAAKLVTAALTRIPWPPETPPAAATELTVPPPRSSPKSHPTGLEAVGESASPPPAPERKPFPSAVKFGPGIVGAKAGAMIGTALGPGVGTAVGGVLGAVVGGAVSLFGTSAATAVAASRILAKKIFISYRRHDSAAAASVYDALAKRYSPANVFYDYSSIPAGVNFSQVIAEWMDSADVVLVLIGPGWLGVETDGTRRVDDPNDFVRSEVRQALAKPQRATIPVLLSDATLPRADQLPDDMRPLLLLQAWPLRVGKNFATDLETLMNAINRLP